MQELSVLNVPEQHIFIFAAGFVIGVCLVLCLWALSLRLPLTIYGRTDDEANKH